MKESCTINGKEYIFLDWRIKPPGLKDKIGVYVQPEALFGAEDGDDIDIRGIHPQNPLLVTDDPTDWGYKDSKRGLQRIKGGENE